MNGARYSYLKKICEHVDNGEDIVIVSDDYAAPVLDGFRVNHPKNYVSVGIAEQNLIAVSCGLALGGKRAIAYGCAPFPLTRAYDQIKNAAAMMNLPITIVNSGIGFAIPEWGATHYNTEDIALMRTIPNIRVITPTDNVMSEVAADYTLTNNIPVYIRFDKYCGSEIYKRDAIDFKRGFNVLRHSDSVAVITCGYFAHKLLALNIDAKIIDLYSLPFDEILLFDEIGNLPIITVEEHTLSGGIGSTILESANKYGTFNKIKRLGIDFGSEYPQTSGSREYFIERYGLSDNDIIKAIGIFSLSSDLTGA